MTIWKRCNDLLFILAKLYLSIVICDKVSTKVLIWKVHALKMEMEKFVVKFLIMKDIWNNPIIKNKLVVKMWQLNSYYHLNYPFFFQIKKNNCDWTSIARWIKVDLGGAEIFTWTRTMSTLVAIYQRLDFSLKKKIDHQNVTTKFLVIILTLKIFFVFFSFWFSYDWNLVVI
jgi:hypothetical protein